MLDKIIIIGTLLGQMQVTSYQSTVSQTDSTPFYTSTGEKVYKGGVAVSRDLLCSACRKLHHRCKHPENSTKVHYGDYIFIRNMGIYKINDCMGPTKWDKKTKKHYPIKQSIDLWVASYQEEKVIGVQFKKVYVLNFKDTIQPL